MKACFRRQKELEEKWWEKRSAWAVEKYKRNRKKNDEKHDKTTEDKQKVYQEKDQMTEERGRPRPDAEGHGRDDTPRWMTLAVVLVDTSVARPVLAAV